MPAEFPYATGAAVAASAILTPLIMTALKSTFPAKPALANEQAELQAKHDSLEKVYYVSMYAGLFGSVVWVSQKKIEADSFMLLLGSMALLPTVSLLVAVVWKRDWSVFSGFMRLQEIKYKMSARFGSGITWFFCCLALIGAISISLR